MSDLKVVRDGVLVTMKDMGDGTYSEVTTLGGSLAKEEKILDNYTIAAGAAYRWDYRPITRVTKVAFGILESVVHSAVFAWEHTSSSGDFLGQQDTTSMVASIVTSVLTSRTVKNNCYLKNSDTVPRSYTVWRYEQ